MARPFSPRQEVFRRPRKVQTTTQELQIGPQDNILGSGTKPRSKKIIQPTLGRPENEDSSQTIKLMSATTNSNAICQKNHSIFFSKILSDV